MEWTSVLMWSLMALGVVLGYFSRQVKNFFQKHINKVKKPKLKEVLTDVNNIAFRLVDLVNKLFVDDLKASAADGKLTDEEKKKAFNTVLEALKKEVPNATLEVLETSGENVGALLAEIIEAQVNQAKKQKTE